MARSYSLAYLTSHTCSAPEAIRLAAELGYACVGLRLLPVAPGGQVQALIGQPDILKETLAAQRDTGVGVYDLEIVRVGEDFDAKAFLPLFEVGAELKARAVLVAGDDADHARLADNYARLCETMRPFGLTADLEFMPWTAVPDAKTALRVIDAAGRPANAGILVDALHAARSSTTLDDLRAIPRELLHYAQVCDAPLPLPGYAFTTEELIHTARCARLLPGEGGIDLKGMIAALPENLPLSVEVVHLERMAQMSARDWARHALEASRRVFE